MNWLTLVQLETSEPHRTVISSHSIAAVCAWSHGCKSHERLLHMGAEHLYASPSWSRALHYLQCHLSCKFEVLGSRKRVILHGNPSAIARDFHRISQSFDINFSEDAVPVMHDVSGSSRRQFWHLCCQQWIHCLASPLENPFETYWREGLSCSPIQFLNTTFDPRAWTMVVFWKESLGRQPQLITLANGRRR